MKHAIDEQEAYFELMMALWSDWMHGRDSHRLGPRSRDSVCGQSQTNYMTASDDSDIVYDENDRRAARQVNACVESLIPSERLAVLIHYGFSRIAWPFIAHQAASTHAGMTELRRLVAKRC